MPPVKMKKINAEKNEETVENEYVKTPKKPSFNSRKKGDDCKDLDDHIKTDIRM